MPDFLFNLIKDLKPAQVLLIGGALFLLWPTLWRYAKRGLGWFRQVPVDDGDYTLTTLTRKWEDLYNACHEAGLHEACDKLEEVFPLFLKKAEKDHDEPERETT